MNDRYLFRGKRIINDSWEIGSLEIAPDNTSYIINYKSESPCEYIYHPHRFTVRTDAVGQCTGLKDKNGKLIFEGDIMLYAPEVYPEPFEVLWEDGGWWWGAAENGMPVCDITDNVGYDAETRGRDEWRGEIIGNITDNPELLKGGSE